MLVRLVEASQHVSGRLEHDSLRCRRARGGARRPTRGAGDGRRAVGEDAGSAPRKHAALFLRLTEIFLLCPE